MRVQLTNTTTRYGLTSKTLHWLIAILFIGLFLSGWYMVDLNYYDSLYYTLPWWHKSFGLLVTLFIILRIFWRWSVPRPIPLTTHKVWENQLASFAHKSLYILPLLICISGYLVTTAKEQSIEFFGWFQFPALLSINAENDWAGLIHEYFSYLVVIIIIVHSAAAIKHHLIDKDETLKRIV